MLAIARQNGAPVSLANAFCKPVRPDGETDLVSASIEVLQDYLGRVYGMCGVRQADAFYIADREIKPLQKPITLQSSGNLDALVSAVDGKISGASQ